MKRFLEGVLAGFVMFSPMLLVALYQAGVFK
jgi:hypothetical protein